MQGTNLPYYQTDFYVFFIFSCQTDFNIQVTYNIIIDLNQKTCKKMMNFYLSVNKRQLPTERRLKRKEKLLPENLCINLKLII
jgi:hypothetical protein